MHQREGIFCGNGRDDSVFVTLVGLHHLTASLLMWLGLTTQNPILWRHGYLLETGYEVADLLSMLFSLYPYRLDGIKPEAKIGLLLHHLPGLCMAPFVMTTHLYQNVHLQNIGSWLLAGAGFSCVVCVGIYTLNYKTQMPAAAALFCSNILFFMYARWYVFPLEALALLDDVSQNEALKGTPIETLLRLGGVLLGIFNLGVTVDLLPKLVRHVLRAFDGITPIETKTVPSSRDSMILKRHGGDTARRSLSFRGSLTSELLSSPILEAAYGDCQETDFNDGDDGNQDEKNRMDRRDLSKKRK